MSRLREGASWALLAVAFAVVTKLGLLFLAPPENVSYFWPASGFLLALLALTPPKRWLRIMLVLFPFGVLLNAWGTGRGVLPSVGYALADLLEAWPAAWLLFRFGGSTLDFGSVRQVVALVLAAAPAGAILSAAVGAAVATKGGSAAGFFATFRTWAISVLVSDILITPLLVTWARAPRGRAVVREMAEAALIVVLLAAVTSFTFAGPAPGGLPLFYLPFPFVFWAALRLGPRGAAMASLTVAVIAVLLSVRGFTNFAPASSTAVRVHWMQLLIGTMAVSALALAAAVEQQRSTATRLREAEARHRVIVEAAPIGVALTDESGAIVHANPAFATIVGRSVVELRGRRFVELTHPEDRESNVEALQELVSGKREYVSFEKRYVRPDDSVVATQLHVAAARDEAGRFVNTITMVVDVSQRKRLEAQLLQSHKMEAIGTLAGGVAHDFNNLLTVILAQARAGAHRASGDPLLADALGDITDAAKRANGLTKQLLALASKQFVEPRIVDVSASLADLLNLVRRLIGDGIEVGFEPGRDTWPVSIDPSQLEQIIINLAVNARDAMPDGGTLTIATRNHSVGPGSEDDRVVEQGDWTVLSITDTGVGMDESVQQHVFEPFFTTKERGKGTGLGLATVHSIVSRANGYIEVTSALGRGTTFRVWLPRANEAVAATAVCADVPVVGAKTVLVVDDEPTVRRVATEILLAHGFAVLEAEDAASALAISESHPSEIDLLLTDVVMPGKSGRALAEELRRSRPSVRVLFTSGYTAGEIARESGTRVLAKPYSSDELITTVQRALATT